MTNYRVNTTDELYHHGVLGQRWGVRRYQNKDGSYTKAGLKRYYSSLDNYNKKKELRDSYKVSSKDRSSGHRDADRNMYRTYKYETKKAKKQLNKDYKHLSQDYKADKGKQLYSEGYRISYNAGTKFMAAGGAIAAGASMAKSMNLISDDNFAAALTTASITASIGSGVKLYNRHKDNYLRAYYGHTSNY